MNIIDRHITAYIFGCLSGDFGEDYQSTKEILLATSHKPENPFLGAILETLKEHDMDNEGVRSAIAKTSLKYFESTKEEVKFDAIAMYSKLDNGEYFFTVHNKKNDVIGIVISNDFDSAKKAILKKFPKAMVTSANSN